MNHVLITGGSGLLGKVLTKALLHRGCTVSHLSRKAGNNPDVTTYLWDVKNGTIDPDCIKGVDVIVHLAGAGIADKKWTSERKKEIIESRTKSIALIYSLLKTKSHQVKTVVSASGVGYYSDRGDELLTEESKPANDFLGQCCVQWEQAVDEALPLGLRVVKFRTGVVLTKKGGALPKLAGPVKYGFGTVLGNGKQWIPWIHIQDVIDMYLMAIEDDTLSGAYNMAAPFPVTNDGFTHAVAQQFRKPLWLPNVPAFALKLILGEMSAVVLGSTKVATTKIEKAGFKFSYLGLEDALKQLYKGH